jgi:outer membrane lipoprotein carrier protein
MEAVKYLYPIAISLFLWLASAPLVHAEPALAELTPTEQLQARLSELDGVIATFVQQLTNAQGFVVEETRGTLYLAKPQFRWEVESPLPQIIIANGDNIEVYDPDLEQVTQRNIEGDIQQAPLALLSHGAEILPEHFSVAYGALDTGGTHFVLTPRSTDALFKSLELQFSGESLLGINIADHSGQQTIIRFEQYQARQVIQSSVFKLDYPPGTDFVRG